MVDLTKKKSLSQYDQRAPLADDDLLAYNMNSAVGNRVARVPLNQAISQIAYRSIMGVYDYNDAGTASAPISIVAADTWYALTNDGLGSFTLTDYGKIGVADVWDASTNSFDWSGLEVGSRVDLRVDITVTTTSANQVVYVHLFNDDGGASEYEIPVDSGSFHKAPGAHRITISQFFYIGNEETKNGLSRLKIKSDGTGSVVVSGWAIGVAGA